MSWFGKHEGRTTGRVLHFLEHYCGLHVADQSFVGEHTVEYAGKPLAEYEWTLIDGEDIPVFKFQGDRAGEEYSRRQRESRDEAIADLESARQRSKPPLASEATTPQKRRSS